MSLTESKVRQAKPKEKIYFLADDDGLSLKVEPNGAKAWTYRYTDSDTKKRSRVKLGVYPLMGLKEARQTRDEYKFNRKEIVLDSVKQPILTFSKVALEWLEFKVENALGDQPRCGVIELAQKCLYNDIIPDIGERAFEDIQRLDLVKTIRKIEKRQVKEPTKKACSYLNQLYDYAVAMGYSEYNIANGLHKILITKKIKKNTPYLKAEEISKFLENLKQVNTHPIIKKALWLKLYTGVRGSEILLAEAEHFDLKNKIWKIPARHVKQFRRKTILGFDIPDYIIPLSTQAVEVVESALEWSIGEKFVFASPRNKDKSIHFNTLNSVIQRMGYDKNQLTSHGLRSTLSTILNDSGLFHYSWIEAQLSHTDKDQVRASYNHAQYLVQRHEMMQWWADYIDVKINDSYD